MRLGAPVLEISALLSSAASPGCIPGVMEQSGGWEGPGLGPLSCSSGPVLPSSPQPCTAHACLYLRMFTDNNGLQPPKADGSVLAIAVLREVLGWRIFSESE